jgi:hypothetical protein
MENQKSGTLAAQNAADNTPESAPQKTQIEQAFHGRAFGYAHRRRGFRHREV